MHTKDSKLLDSLTNVCRSTKVNQINGPARQLEQEAKRQKNDMSLGHAYYCLCRYHAFQYEAEYSSEEIADSVIIYGEKSKEYYTRAGSPDMAVRPQVTMIQWESRFGSSEQALIRLFDLKEELKKIENIRTTLEIYNLLGDTYLDSNSPQEALEAYTSLLNIIREGIKAGENLNRHYVSTFVKLANAADLAKDHNQTLAYCDSIRAYLPDHPDELVISIATIAADVFTLDALIYQNKLKEARPVAEKLQLRCDSITPENRFSYYYTAKKSLGRYYSCVKKYERALDSVEEAIQYFTLSNSITNKNRTEIIKADILAATENYKEAFYLESQIRNFTDSLSKANTARTLNQMETVYITGKFEKQIIRHEARTQRLLLISGSLVVICILLIAMFLNIKSKNKKIRKKNEKLFEQYKSQQTYQEKITEQTRNSDKESTKEPSLFTKLEQYLAESLAYEDPEISREMVASQLGTNREYLIRAIQENAGMTFNEYINHYRLEYTCQLLCEDIDSTIKSIYISAGFNNERTFYRLFKQKYGMNPKEFRAIAIQSSSKK